MSKISQDFVNNVGFLYEQIHIQNQDFLNEDSEHYDEEAAELVEDILSSICLSMVYEGYSANAVIGFLADAPEEEIIEKYLNFDESILNESTVSEEYILEQLEIFDAAINEGLGSLIGKAATGIGKMLAKRAPALKSAGPLTQKAATRLAMKGKPTAFTKAKVGLERMIGPKGRKAVQSVKDLGSKAKEVLPGVAKGALLAGTGVLTGYAGAKLAGAGSGTEGAPKPSPSGAPSLKAKQDYAASKGKYYSSSDGKTYANYNDALAAKNSRRGTSGVTPGKTPTAPSASSGGSGGGASSSSTSAKPTAPAKPKASEKAPEGETAMQKWARLHPNLASKVKLGQSGYDEISAKRDTPGPSEKKDQTSTTGSPEAKIDTSSVQADIKKEQERLKKKAEQTPVTAKESYDAYEVVLEYLIDTEQVETLDEAHYVMLEMDAETIGDIVEAKYGTSKGRRALAKKVRAGEDVGKKGEGFGKIVSKATPKYGKERATKIAAAAMWKNLGK